MILKKAKLYTNATQQQSTPDLIESLFYFGHISAYTRNSTIMGLAETYTLKRLKSDTQFRAHSIKSIAQEVGYKSADSFTKHFKKQTSLYPSII